MTADSKIADQILDMIKGSDDETIASFINDFCDTFRDGRSLDELVPLLEHSDSDVVWVGAWTVSEVAIGDQGREVFESLVGLLNHPDSSVRFAAIGGVANIVQPQDGHAVKQLLALLADADAGVRQHALFHSCLLPDSTVRPAASEDDQEPLRLLLRGAERWKIEDSVSSADLLSRRLAIAGALRNYGHDQQLLDTISQSDPDIAGMLQSMPRNRVA